MSDTDLDPCKVAAIILSAPGMKRCAATLEIADQAALLLSGKAVWDAAVTAERAHCARVCESSRLRDVAREAGTGKTRLPKALIDAVNAFGENVRITALQAGYPIAFQNSTTHKALMRAIREFAATTGTPARTAARNPPLR